MSKLQGNLFDMKKSSSIAFAASSVAMAGPSGKNDGSYSETQQQMKEEEENSTDYKLNTLDGAQVCEQKYSRVPWIYHQSSAGGRFWPPRPHRDLRQTPPWRGTAQRWEDEFEMIFAITIVLTNHNQVIE